MLNETSARVFSLPLDLQPVPVLEFELVITENWDPGEMRLKKDLTEILRCLSEE